MLPLTGYGEPDEMLYLQDDNDKIEPLKKGRSGKTANPPLLKTVT
jgi:hypothetical protein